MDNIKSYGAGLAGGEFDAKSFIRRPSVICRLFAAVFAVVIWFCMYKGGWHRDIINPHLQYCLYNGSSSTCSFMSAMGFFSLATAVILLAADAQFDKITAVQVRSRVVRADLAASGLFGITFLLSLVNTAVKYNKLEMHEPFDGKYAKLAAFLNLLSAAAWGSAAYLAWKRFQAGQTEGFQGTEFDTGFQGISGEVAEGYGYGGNYEGVGAVTRESYQEGGHQPLQQVPQLPPTNPFAGQPGYQY